MQSSLVVMGVAGCGKSSLGAALAATGTWALLEGDDFHSAASRTKMQAGVPLTDADRDGWLTELCTHLAAHASGHKPVQAQANPEANVRVIAQADAHMNSPVLGLVLTCSALKRAYRERLRQAAPGLQFVFLKISEEKARERVQSRGNAHFFAANLVHNQFTTLESPADEMGVLTLDAVLPLPQLVRQVQYWITHKETA